MKPLPRFGSLIQVVHGGMVWSIISCHFVFPPTQLMNTFVGLSIDFEAGATPSSLRTMGMSIYKFAVCLYDCL